MCVRVYILIHRSPTILVGLRGGVTTPTYLTDGAEHEAEGDPWSRPAFGQSITTTVGVEDMTTLQLHRKKPKITSNPHT